MSHNEFVIRRKEVEMAHDYVTQDMFFLRDINLQYAVIEASISDNAKVFYMLLWKKAMEEKIYENGKLYVIARIIDTAVEMGKSSSSVKRAFRELEQFDLIERKRVGGGMPSKIFLKYMD